MTEIVNLSISQSAASELSRQASFGGSPGEMSIDLVEDKNCSEGWMHIKLRPGTCNGSPISRTEGVTLYADVKKFNLLKDLKLDYFGDLSGGGFLISTPKMQNVVPVDLASNFCAFFCKLILFSLIGCSQDKINKKFIEIKFTHDRDE